MSSPHGRHCPYCNSSAVVGLGALFDATQVIVELRCRDCGNLFISEDRRVAEPPQQANP